MSGSSDGHIMFAQPERLRELAICDDYRSFVGGVKLVITNESKADYTGYCNVVPFLLEKNIQELQILLSIITDA